MPLDQAILDRAFDVLVHAAMNGERCPKSGERGINSAITTALARAGRIKIEVSGRNWRTVTILVGPHASKTTQPDPNDGHIYQTIGLVSDWTPKPHGQITHSDRARRLARFTRRSAA